MPLGSIAEYRKKAKRGLDEMEDGNDTDNGKEIEALRPRPPMIFTAPPSDVRLVLIPEGDKFDSVGYHPTIESKAVFDPERVEQALIRLLPFSERTLFN